MPADTIIDARQRSSPAGSEKTPRQKRSPPKKITESYLHNSGLYYLQRFSSSRKNFISVMDRKIKKSCRAHPEQSYEASRAMLEKIADRFEQSGLLNDGLYTGGVVDSLKRRGFSRSGIIQKLAQKGIAKELALQKIQQHEASLNEDEDPELTTAIRLSQKKRIGPYSTRQDEKTHQRFFSALARAGYSYEIARKVLQAAQSPED